jgi:hypothetical protein
MNERRGCYATEAVNHFGGKSVDDSTGKREAVHEKLFNYAACLWFRGLFVDLIVICRSYSGDDNGGANRTTATNFRHRAALRSGFALSPRPRAILPLLGLFRSEYDAPRKTVSGTIMGT